MKAKGRVKGEEGVPHTEQWGGGRIIVLNSYAGIQGVSHSSTFCASRFALNGFVQSAAAETLASKIRFVFQILGVCFFEADISLFLFRWHVEIRQFQ